MTSPHLQNQLTLKWITQLEVSITNTRRNISQIEIVLKCKQENKFTKHQRKSARKVPQEIW